MRQESLDAAILEGALFQITRILRGVPTGLDWIPPEFESPLIPQLQAGQPS
jgi:hypothetical protein